jgi:hypothetical protein
MLRKREQILPEINNVWIMTHNSMLISFSCISRKMSKLITVIKYNPNKGETSLFVRVNTAMKTTQPVCITYGKPINCLCYLLLYKSNPNKGETSLLVNSASLHITYGKSINFLAIYQSISHKSSRPNKIKMESEYACVS